MKSARNFSEWIGSYGEVNYGGKLHEHDSIIGEETTRNAAEPVQSTFHSSNQSIATTCSSSYGQYYAEQSELLLTSKLLHDWQKLWYSLESDPTDEISRYVPLFHLLVEFFFHKISFQITILLFFFSTFCTILLRCYLRSDQILLICLSVLTNVIKLVVYRMVFILFCNGVPCSAFGIQNSSRKYVKNDLRRACDKMSGLLSDDWIHARQYFFNNSLNQLNWFCKDIFTPTKNFGFLQKGKAGNIGYFHFLNTSLKVLLSNYSVKSNRLKLNRPTYRLMILFIVLVFPVYVTVCSFLLRVFLQPFFSTSKWIWHIVLICQYSIDAIFSFIVGGGILTALVGLSYTSEILSQLSELWIEKFSCLRRLSPESELITSSAIVKEWSLRSGNRLKELSQVLTQDATEQFLLIREVVAIASKIWSPVVTVCFILTVCIIANYHFMDGSVMRIPSKEFRYFSLFVYACSRCLLLIIYPIMSISYTNSHIYHLHNVFKVSASDDYKLLKNRCRWLESLVEMPAIWTYYGLWVTWDRLFGIVWTGCLGISAYIVSSGLPT